MKLKLPFFNKQNYIVLNCYHANKRTVELAPIVLSSKLPELPFNNRLGDKNVDKSFLNGSTEILESEGYARTQPTARTCYANIASLKISATVPMWTSCNVRSTENNGIFVEMSDKRDIIGAVDYRHTNDPYFSSPDMVIVKLITSWHLEEKTGVPFVLASHLRNFTPMRIPSGIMNYRDQHSVNIFNFVHLSNHEYTVKFGTPIVSLYPMTDKKLYVESHYDPQKSAELLDRSQTKPYFMHNVLKMGKLTDMKNKC